MKEKALIEQRNDLQAKADKILNTVKAEERIMTAEEKADFDNAINKIDEIDETLDRFESFENRQRANVTGGASNMTQEEKDIKNFAAYIRGRINGVVNSGEATHLTEGENGAVIPKTIAKKIIARAKQLSPIYNLATKYPVKGNLEIPVVDASTDDITVSYATEFSALTSHAPALDAIQLKGFLYAALSKISKSFATNTDVDLVNFVVERMAQKVADWKENQLINGTENKILGIARSYDSTNMKVTLAKKSSVTVDELIDIKHKVPQFYRKNAGWIVNPDTLTAIKKLKDGEGRYIFNEEDNTILSKPVYESENAPALGTAGNLAIIFGDFSGLAVKETEELEITILNELFATEHAIGVVAYGEMDSQVENRQMIVCAACGSSD